MSPEGRRLLLWIALAIVALWLLQRFRLQAAIGIGASSSNGGGGSGGGAGAGAAASCCGGCADRRTSAEFRAQYTAAPGDYSAGGYLDGGPIEIAEAPWFGSPAPIAGPVGNYTQG